MMKMYNYTKCEANTMHKLVTITLLLHVPLMLLLVWAQLAMCSGEDSGAVMT